MSAVSGVHEDEDDILVDEDEKLLAKYPKVDLADEIDGAAFTTTINDKSTSLIDDITAKTTDEKSVSSSLASSHESLASNMSWEPEVSTELLSTSMNSIYYRCSSEADLLNPAPLTAEKRSHSIGYLPTYEWTVTDIPLDDGSPLPPSLHHDDNKEVVVNSEIKTKASTDYYKIYDDDFEDYEDHKNTTTDIKPPPESFYTLVPVTPLHGRKTFEQQLKEQLDTVSNTSSQGTSNTTSTTTTTTTTTRKVAYKKQSKLRKHVVERTLSNNTKKNHHHHHEQHRMLRGGGGVALGKRLQRNSPPLERSSSWPSLVNAEE